MLFKLDFPKNFANLIGKHLRWSLFNKVAGRKSCNFIKKRLQHRCFRMKFAKFQETLFLYRALPMFASESSIIDVRQVSAEAAVRRCSSKKVLLKISQYLQENTSVGDSF